MGLFGRSKATQASQIPKEFPDTDAAASEAAAAPAYEQQAPSASKPSYGEYAWPSMHTIAMIWTSLIACMDW